jgi:hypothetical protein
MTNRTAKDLHSIARRPRNHKTALVLGQVISKAEMNMELAPVCPTCVREKGFMEAHFSLSLMTICPQHGLLLNVCPGCAKPLTWKRAGLLECNCGQLLCQAAEHQVSTAVVELLDIVRTKTLALPTRIESISGLPVCALGSMSLRSLLFLIRSLGRRCVGDSGKSDSSMEKTKIVEVAAQGYSVRKREAHFSTSETDDPP